MTLTPGDLDLLVGRSQRMEDLVDAPAGAVFCHDQTLSGSSAGRGVPSNAPAPGLLG